MTAAGTQAGVKIHAAAIAFLPKSQGGTFGPVPYKFGYASHAATDCSGMTMQCCAVVGIHIPHNSDLQWQQAAGGHVPRGQEQPGDIVYFAGSEAGYSVTKPGHCGIVDSFDAKTGTGVFIDAPFTGVNVRRDTFSIQTTSGPLAYTGATRPRNLIH